MKMEHTVAKSRCDMVDITKDNQKVMKVYDSLVNELVDYYGQNNDFDIGKLIMAIIYAAKKHDGQYRKDKEQTPYIVHPLGVCYILWNEGRIRSINVLVSSLLHDVIEDTDASYEEIEILFGKRVADTVLEVTNDPNLDSEMNKQLQVEHAPHLSLNAQLVKLADRLYNVRDLRTPPPSWSEEKVHNYYEWGRKLLHALKGTNETLEEALRLEINRYRQE